MTKKEKADKTNIKAASFENITRIYSNSVNLSFSLYDFQLLFGNTALNTISESHQIEVDPQILVHMSPQHFKVMVDILNNYLEKYERNFGEIAISKDSSKKKVKAQKR